MPKKTRNTGLPKIKQLPSGAYHAQVYSHTDENGKRRYESFTSYDYNALLVELAQYKAAKKEQKIKKASHKMTLQEAVDSYIRNNSAVLSPSTYKEYSRVARTKFKHLMPMDINDITASVLQEAINREAMVLSPKSVKNNYGVISAALRFYRPDFSPKVLFPQKKPSSIQIPSTEEVAVIMEQVKDTRMEIPVMLAALCGMRRSEISALTWGDIDLKKGTLHISKALVKDINNNLVEKQTKTVSSDRTIRLFPLVLDVLKSKRGDAPADQRICPIPTIITRDFFKILNKVGCPHYRFHDLRHYACSVMLGLGIPKTYIADYLGHETEHMIDQVYGHIMKDMKTQYEDTLNTYYTGAFAKAKQ